MLDKEKIQQAESNVRQYLEEDLLKKTSDTAALQTYRENSDLSLETAEKLLTLETTSYKPFLWVLVASYYAMYYIANAVLLHIGYKVGDRISHKVTSDALIVFARNRLKKELLEEYEKAREDALELTASRADTLLDSFEKERRKRSTFMYQMDESVKKSKATTSLDRAKSFVFEMKKLLP